MNVQDPTKAAPPPAPKAGAAVTNGSGPPKASDKDLGPSQGAGTVWNVVSGDSLEVCLGVANGVPTLKKITLAGVIAPRLGIRTQQTSNPDEPCAWESREFLRGLALAKKVQFRSLYHSQSGDRDYCEVRLVDGDKTHFGLQLMAAGLARVAPGNAVKNLPFYEELVAAEQTASAGGQGIFSPNAADKVRNLQNANDFDFDYEAFFKKNQYKERKCIVEFIRDAGCYRLVVCPEEAGGE